jgi:hypothetical protein
MMDAAFATLLDNRIGRRWRNRLATAHLDNHLRRDIGLPPREAPALPLLYRL